MMFKKYEWRIVLRVFLLFAMLCAAAFLLVKAYYVYFAITVPIVIYQVIEFYRFAQKAHTELDQFVESVHYRDFSRYFDVKHAPLEIQPLRQGFNEINSTLKSSVKKKKPSINISRKYWSS